MKFKWQPALRTGFVVKAKMCENLQKYSLKKNIHSIYYNSAYIYFNSIQRPWEN